MWPYQQPPRHPGYPIPNAMHQPYYQPPGGVNPDDLAHAAEQWARMQAPVQPPPPQQFPQYGQDPYRQDPHLAQPPWNPQPPAPQQYQPHPGMEPQSYAPHPRQHFPPPGNHQPFPGHSNFPGVQPGFHNNAPSPQFHEQPLYQGPPVGHQPARYPHGGLLPPPQNDPVYGRPPEAVYHPPEPYGAPRPPWQPPPAQHYPPAEMQSVLPDEHTPAPYYQYTLEGKLEYIDPSGAAGGGDYQYAGFDFESYSQSQSAEALKKLPPWIREGLEKLEKEKQKEREKQRFMQEYESRVKEESTGVKSGRSRFSSSPSRSRSGSPELNGSGSEEDDVPLSEEERQMILIQATKEMVTTVLMGATTKVLEKTCLEEIDARKLLLKQAAAQPVRMSAALASLAQFGSSDSESDEERLPPPPPGALKSLSTAQKLSENTTALPEPASRQSSSDRSPTPKPKTQRERRRSPLPGKETDGKSQSKEAQSQRNGSPLGRRKNGSTSPSRPKLRPEESPRPTEATPSAKRSRRRSSSAESDRRSRRKRGESPPRPNVPSSARSHKRRSPSRDRAKSPPLRKERSRNRTSRTPEVKKSSSSRKEKEKGKDSSSSRQQRSRSPTESQRRHHRLRYS